MRAEDTLVAGCLAKRGVVYSEELFASIDPLYDVSTYFGVWTEDIASRFGYAPPLPSADLKANGVAIDAAAPDAGRSAEASGKRFSDSLLDGMSECRKEPEVQIYRPERIEFGGPWSQEFSDATERALSGTVFEQVTSEYRACLVDKGLAVDETGDGGLPHPVGARGDVISAEQIELALQDVDCKTQVRLVERLSDEVARQQAPIVHRYARELTALRAELDELLAAAQEAVDAYEG